jgi:hypothetical protein
MDMAAGRVGGAGGGPVGLPSHGGDVDRVGLAVEVGDSHWLTGNSIDSLLGLTPSEHFSGGSRSVGGSITYRYGHAGRLLKESSWLHRKPYRPSAEMTNA